MDTYYEKLLNEAMSGDKDSLKELMSNAGSGNAEAQYYLALYYGNMKDNDNYLYWICHCIWIIILLWKVVF